MRLTTDLIQAIAETVEQGLNVRDACILNDVGEADCLEWIQTAKRARAKSRRTESDIRCIDFVQAVEKAKLRRKQRLIDDLRNSNSPKAKMFLLRSELL